MSDTTIARRYAQALYQEAEAKGLAPSVDQDMEVLGDTLGGSRDLALFFGSQLISRQKKEAVVDRLFAGRVHPLILNLMRLLIAKRREDLLPNVIRVYRELRDERLGITDAEVRVAAELAPEELEELESSLAAMTGSRVRLKVRHQPELIGGAIVRVGDTVYDGSIRHQLAVLREQLEQGAFKG